MSETFDLAVVGAGPGGSNAAAAALAGGLDVVQLERARFPRVKPCAGGLTIKACRALAPPLASCPRATFASFEFALWRGGALRFSLATPVLEMVLRPELDRRLVEQNREHPRFRFHDGEPVRQVVREGDGFRIVTDARELRARQLVAADGANGAVSRRFGVARPARRAVAVELVLARARARLEREVPPVFDFGAIPKGYGWIFPKDDHWSVGLYSLDAGGRDLRGELLRYLAARGFEVDGDPLDTFEAHTIPLGGHRLRVPDFPLYVVGDAGGFADAVTGEGIFHALESGRLAGETAVRVARGEASHRAYYRGLWRRVLPDTWLTNRLADAVYADLPRALDRLAWPLVWRPLVLGYGRGATVTESLLRGALYLPLSLLGGRARLARSRAGAAPLAEEVG